MQNIGLIEKIQKLPAETIVEIEHFVDFLTEKQNNSFEQKRCEEMLAFAEEFGGTAFDLDEDLEAAGARHLSERGIMPEEAAAQRAALATFAEDWERPEMEVYDKL